MMQAKEFAIKAHGMQMYGALPYIAHLQSVVSILVRFGVRSPVLLEAAWLHDVLEDTATTPEELLDQFGAPVASLVRAVTGVGATRAERNVDAYRKIRAHGMNAVILKLADRIANAEHSIERETPHLEVCRREFPAFETALYQPGEADSMWQHMRELAEKCVKKKFVGDHMSMYKRLKFTAQSGNSAAIKIFPPNGDRLVVDVTWVVPPSPADINEHDAWFPEGSRDAVAFFKGKLAAHMISQVIEDDDDRQVVIAALLAKPRMG